MSEQNGQDAGESLAASVVKSYEDAAKTAYERAKGDPDTTKAPPTAAPEADGNLIMGGMKLERVNEQKSETEPDDNKIDPGPEKESKAADKTAYKRADIADPYSLQDAVQAEYEAACKRSYARASTGKNNDKGDVNGS